MREFSLGDRVAYVDRLDVDMRPMNKDYPRVGETGVVCQVNGNKTIGVRWNEYRSVRHDCDGDCEEGHGWYVPTHQLQLIDEGGEDASGF